MSYISTIQPSFQASRLAIQKSIMNLEQRLLRRKELDLQIEKQLLEHDNMQRKRKQQTAYNTKQRGYGVEQQLQERLMLLKTLDYRQHVAKQIQRQQLQQDYIARLKAIERQEQMMVRQIAIKKHAELQSLYNQSNRHNYYENTPYHLLDESGEMLARKYFDGTRALEFDQELKKADTLSDRKGVLSKDRNDGLKEVYERQLQRDHSTVKKYLSSAQKYDSGNNGNNPNNSIKKALNIPVDPSPIKLIQNSPMPHSTYTKAQQLQRLNNEVQKMKRQYSSELKKIQQKQSIDNESPILKSKNMSRSRTKSTQPTTQYIKEQSPTIQHAEHYVKDRSKSSVKKSRYMSSRQRSSKSLKQLNIINEIMHNPTQSMQQRVHKEIQLRAVISQKMKQVLDIFYAKNIPEYLMTVCEKEDKFRQELRDKIAKIPSVQRRYDVGPVLE